MPQKGEGATSEVTAQAAPEAAVKDTLWEAKQGSREVASSQASQDKSEQNVLQPIHSAASHLKNDQILVELDSPR